MKPTLFKRAYSLVFAGVLSMLIQTAEAATDLADQPIFTGSNVTGNVALALSVEFPTALGSAYTTDYATTNTYLGYFNPEMCYDYRTDAALAKDTQPDLRHYFMPSVATTDHTCKSKWSGNFLNWALTQTIDPFRFALSGGYRVIDEVGLTVLEKAYATGQGGTVATPRIYNNQDLVSKSTPFNVKNITIRIGKAGTSFIISTCDPTLPEHVGSRVDANGNVVLDGNNKPVPKPTCVDYINTVKTATDVTPVIPQIRSDKDIPLINPVADTAIPKDVGDNQYYALHAAVRVCVPDEKLRESNCVKYGNDYKPEGLIQKNALKLNFAAFGYAVTDQNDKVHVNNAIGQNGDIDGGVLRAKMRPVGPLQSVPNAPNIANPHPEWSAETGIFDVNPDTVESGKSGVGNSGVINYLNKFGKINGNATLAKGYKRLDSVSELYYTALRYFRHLGPVASYTANLDAAMKDGFPVITDWDDPIQYQCQKNFIIGVGDTNAWLDASLPGSTITTKEGHAMPPEVDADKTVDVRLATNQVGLMQDGTANLGELVQSNSRYNTFFIAGLAYDAHTKDIRPATKDSNGVITDSLSDNQTVTTYWLDVLESGFIAANRNQYYLAAKFGGFEVPSGFDPYAANPKALNATLWDKNGDGDPDNYFRANNPALMISGLSKAFNDILKEVAGSSSAFALTSPSVVAGGLSFASTYQSTDADKKPIWTGDVTASKISVGTNGAFSLSQIWSAAAKLEAKSWESRVIATSACTINDNTNLTETCVGKPFKAASAPVDLASVLPTLGTTADAQIEMINFLRGDKTNDGIASKTTGITYRKRVQLLGDIVNSQVLALGPPSAPFTDTFNPGYSEFKTKYANRQTLVYVGANDGMLHAFDAGTGTGDKATGGTGDEVFAYIPNALFSGPNNTPSTDGLAALAKFSFVHHFYVNATPRAVDIDFSGSGSDWHTILVGGLGKGGKSYYALDVTDPSALKSDTGLASKVLWEFQHKLMGYSFGRPLLVKVKNGKTKKWILILTSGYNNVDGKGYFFIVDPATGKLLQDPIATGAGSETVDAGLAQVTAYVSDARDFTADAAYAGDLLGNVWRLDLTGTLGSYAAPTRLTNVGQPITMPPVVEIDQATSKRYVFVGTGRLLALTDVNVTQDNAIFALNDGSDTNFSSSSIKLSDLVDVTSNVNGVDASANPTSRGYFIKIGADRVNVEMKSAGGILLVGANSTTNSACTPDGVGAVYAFEYGTGKTALASSQRSETQKGAISGVGFYNINGSLYAGAAIGGSSSEKGALGSYQQVSLKSSSAMGFTRMNWRELPINE